jgi:MoaA/NifB/PqqE/SkfB family radical SAM enzyme
VTPAVADTLALLRGRIPASMRVKRQTVDSFLRFARGGPAPPFPAEIYLEVSNVCDLRCVMCPRFSAFNPDRKIGIREADPGFLGSNPATEALRPLLERALSVHVFGYGEPTIHPDFANLLTHVAQFDVLIDFFTNGMHLTEALARQVVELSVHRITLSFSGATRETYESVYQGGEFDQVLAGLVRLQEEKRKAGTRYPQLHVNSLSFDHHVADLDRFVDLMADHGAERIEVTRLLEHPSMLSPLVGHAADLRSPAMRSAVDRARRRAQERGIGLSLHASLEAELALPPREPSGAKVGSRAPVESFRAIAASLPVRPPPASPAAPLAVLDLDHATPDEIRRGLRVRGLRVDSSGGFFACMEPFKTFYVRRGGQVKPCCYSADDAPALGHVDRWDGREIWNGPGFAAVRGAIANGEYPLATCASCLQNRQAPPGHGVDRMISDYAQWARERGGDLLDRGAIAELKEAGTGWEILERAWKGPDRIEFPGTAERTRRMLELVHDVPKLSDLEGRFFEGWIDAVSPDSISGWVWSPAFAEIRVPLWIYRNGSKVAEVVARNFRGDLLAAGKGDGRHAFHLRLDPPLSAGESATARLAETACEIDMRVGDPAPAGVAIPVVPLS